MIVKIQKPMSSSAPNPPVLVYNRERNFEQMLPYSDFWDALFEQSGLEQYGKVKLFAEVHLDRNILVVDRALKEDLGW